MNPNLVLSVPTSLQAYKSKLILFFFLLLCSVTGNAQAVNNQIKDVVMPSANAASLGKYGDIPVSYNTGVPSVGIPIHTVTDGPVSLPISLNYHAGGLKVGEPCSWVGLNWSLSAGGMISRTVQGRADERENGYFSMGKSVGVSADGKCIQKDGSTNDEVNGTFNGQLATGQMDGEPDIFSFSVGGYNGKFYIDVDNSADGLVNGKVILIPKQDVKVDYTIATGDFTEKALSKFTITTPDGVKYEFGDIGDNNSAIEVTRPVDNTAARYASGWYLKRIITPDTKSWIKLNYTQEIYRFGSKSTNSSPNLVMSPQGGYYQSMTDNFGYRLNTIVTSTTTEVLSFITGADRQDVTTTVGASAMDNAKVLSAIQIANGTYCKRFELDQTYFQDLSTKQSGQYTDKRLKLLSVQEESCTGTNDISNPPHKFLYHGKLGDTNYLPNRLSSAIDHWGYYNDATTNPITTGTNIPYTRLRFKTAPAINTTDSIALDMAQGSSNRETNEEAMRWGTIKQIIYPTGGTSTFEYEANTYWDSVGRKILEDQPYSLTHVWSAGSCETSTYTDNPATSPSSTFFITFPTTAELSDWYYKWETIHPTYTGTCNDGNIATVSVFLGNATTAFKSINMSGSNNAYNTAVGNLMLDISNTFQANIPYRFELRGRNVGSRFVLQKEVSIEQNQNKKVGGLRIKKITTNDGTSTANDIVKSYEYGTTQSSGLLYQKPIYGYVYRGVIGTCFGMTPQNTINGFFMENPIVPLGSFEGNHLNYNSVKENYVVNGVTQYYTVYQFNNEPIEGFKGIPVVPIQPRIGSGEMTNKQLYNNAAAVVASEANTPYTDAYETGVGTYIKFNTYNSGVAGGNNISFWSKYAVRTRSYRMGQTVSMVDNVTSTTTYTYDSQNRFLMPTEVATTNSDGKTYTTKNFYSRNLPSNHPNINIQNVFEYKYMIGIPLQSEQYINSIKVGGYVLQDSIFENPGYPYGGWQYTAILFPYKSYSINRDSSLKLNVTVSAYDKGLPSQLKHLAFAVYQNYTWDVQKRLLGKNFGTLNWAFNYNGTSALVNQITDENGLIKKFTYDKLMRLDTIKDRMKPDGTDIQATMVYDYHYKNSPTDYNYVGTTSTFKGVTAPLSTKQYMDGLGRPIEVVKELYTPPTSTHPNDYWHQKNYVKYDSLGRQNKSYLPFESNILGFEVASAYTSSYVLTEYEKSPLSRPIKQTNVDNTVVATSYGANTALDSVRIMIAAGGNGASSSGGSFYAANLLYKTTMFNENAKQTDVFKDKLGRVILTRKFLGTQKVDTYNVYDDYGQLVAVLPPGSVNSSGGVTNSLTFQYVYDSQNRLSQKTVPGAYPQKFFYDNRDLLVLTQDGNMYAENTTKHLATLYDDLGRVVKTGFAFVSPTQGQNFTLTDTQITDKLTETIYYPNKTWVKHQGAKVLKQTGVSTYTDFVWSYIERRAGLEYTGNPVWTGKQHLLYPSVAQRPIDDNDSYGVDWSVSGYNGMQQADLSIRYLFTGTSAAEVRTRQDFEYDNGRRMTYSKYAYALNGAGLPSSATFNLSNMVYNYKDQLEEKNIGRNGANSLQSIDYTYNLRGWLTAINNVTIYGNNTPIMTPPMSGSGYIQNLAISPFIKQAINESLATPPLGVEGLTATPPVMTDNNTDLFSQALTYGSPDSRFGVDNQYNGNISSTTWQVLGRDKQAYGFKYDDLDRLTESKYFDITDSYNSSNHQWSSSYSTDYKFNESSTYDVRGNITFLQRNGLNGGSWTSNGYTAATYGLIDNLTYTYGDSNRLKKVTDASLTDKGFIYKNASATRSYEYDYNGNLKSDLNKGIISIEYNYLNLPMKIVFNRTFMTSYSNGSIEFIYDATGAKLRKTVKDVNGNVLDTRDYVNGVEYNNGTLSRIAHTEGSVARNEFGAYEHQYALRDHLGNTRVTFRDGINKGEAYFDWTTYTYVDPNYGNTTGLNDGVITSADIMQINNYYPFGLNMEGNWNGSQGGNKYQYNGKEWNDDFGLGWNDYGARFYDPAVARWGNVDPLSEKYGRWSPYNYGMNNPIKFIDPTGMASEAYNFGSNNYQDDQKERIDESRERREKAKNEKVELYYTNATSGKNKLSASNLVDIISKTAKIFRKNGILQHLSFKSISMKEAQKYEKGGRGKGFIAIISDERTAYGKSDISNDQGNYIGVYSKENEKFTSYVSYGRIVSEKSNFPDPIYGTAWAMAHEYLHQLLSFAGTVLDKNATRYIHRTDYRNLNFDGEADAWTFPLQKDDDIIIPEQIQYLNRYFEYLKTH